MLTRQVLESQRKQSRRQLHSWDVEIPLPQLWGFAHAWLRHRVALASPAPSLRHPGWVTGELPWTGPRPWLELPFCWQEEKRFRVEHLAGPQAYLCWEIHCEARSPRQSRLSLSCQWHWKQEALLQDHWQTLCNDIVSALPSLHRLFALFPVQHLTELRKAGQEILTLWGYVEQDLCLNLTGATRPLIWEWFQELTYQSPLQHAWAHIPSRTLLHTPEQWLSHTTGQGFALFFYPGTKESEIRWPLDALKHQHYLWPQESFALRVPTREPVPWQHQQMQSAVFLAGDPLAPVHSEQSLQEAPGGRYQWIHPKGQQQFINRGKAPEALAYAKPRHPKHSLEHLFTDPMATPYLFQHWPESHPLTLNLSLCLVSTTDPHTFAAGMANTLANSLKQGRLLLSSAQGILLAFPQTPEALTWLLEFYAQAPTWEKWGFLSEGFVPQIALSEGPVKIYPQQGYWRVLGNQVRTLNEGANQSQGAVVMSAELLATPAVLHCCQQQAWQVHYVAEHGTAHLLPKP